jgi:hypothetical protein
VWVVLLAVLLGAFVLLFGRFERRGLGRAPPPLTAPTAAAAGAAGVAAALLMIGVLGFAMGGMHQLFSKTGTELIVFGLNPFHNVLHLLIGWLLLWSSARSRVTIRAAALASGVLLLGLTGLGIAMAADPSVNYLAANTADNLFHAVLAGAAGLVAVSATPVAGMPDRDEVSSTGRR